MSHSVSGAEYFEPLIEPVAWQRCERVHYAAEQF